MNDRSDLAESNERYRQILDTAPDAMVVVGLDSRIELVNRQTEKMFGYDRSELLGKPLDVLIPKRFHGVHAHHLTRYFESPSVRPMGSGLRLFGQHKDGSEIAIEVSLSPVRTGTTTTVSAAIRDVTERNRIEAIAKLNAERLASAVESMQDAFALFDSEDRLVLCNSMYRSLIGNNVAGSLVGRPYSELLGAWVHEIEFSSEEEHERFRKARLEARRSDTGSFEVRMRDGRHLRVTDRRTAEGGNVKIIWDLTDDIRAAEELREARATAEAASAAKSEFLSSMSHELRTPLNAILGFAQLLQRDKKEPLSTRHKDRADQILRGGEHLLRLIDDILDLSRIEAGRLTISKEPVEVAAVLDELKSTLESMALGRGVSVVLEPIPAGCPSIHADRTRFAQILMNLGSNAIKYNRPSGTVTLSVSVPEPTRVRILVSDTGMGIPADKQDKLFQPFQRAGQETGPIEGTGIGLVITKQLAALMGGTVGFESTFGVGSHFWVDLPAVAARSRLDALSTPSAKATSTGSIRGRVLYVEDNPANVAFMRDVIEGLDDVQLLTAPTAEMGIELARVRPPDVILMDINLPGMSGLDALGALRRIDELKDVPIVALTAAASSHDEQRGLKAGFFRYLTKPIKVDDLVSLLESLLANAH